MARSTWYLVTLVFVSFVALTGWNVWYTNHVAQEGNSRWCGTLRVYHDAYASNPPPPTQLGKDIQAELERLYRDFRCDTVRKP